MPNIHTSTITGSVPAAAGVGIVSEIIVPANVDRNGLMITNISDGTIYLGIDTTATLKAGIVLIPGGGSWSMDDFSYSKGAITAIGHSATLIVAFQEFYR